MGKGTSKAGGGKIAVPAKPYDRFATGNIEMKTYNKLPKYVQDSVIAVDSYDPRKYGYNEPINYHLYYVNDKGVVDFVSEDGADFLGQLRFMGKTAFGKVSDYDIPSNYEYNTGDVLKKKTK